MTKVEPQPSIVTYNRDELAQNASNIYEAIVIMGKRAEQVSSDIKEEISKRLDEFTSHTDTLDEVFENREQIEVSKHFENQPKPTAIAISEWRNDDIYVRKIEDNS